MVTPTDYISETCRRNIPPALREIADREILTALFMDDRSLLGGQTGCAIFFALLSRASGCHWYEDFADELLEQVCGNLTRDLPVSFGRGLCGIGWGIEFLRHTGFIGDDTDEILSEIDAAVMERDVRRITDDSLETGLKGILAYVESRLASKRHTAYVPFDESYLAEVKERASRLGVPVESSGIENVWRDCLRIFDSQGGSSWRKGLSILCRHE